MDETSAPDRKTRVELRPAWRRKDPQLEADAIAFWEQRALMPPGVFARDHAAHLCVVAYIDGAVAGVTSAKLGYLASVRSRMAFYRCAVDPDRRNAFVLPQITEASRVLLLDWARANPQEGINGMATIVDYPYAVMRRTPIWRHGGVRFVLAGHTPEGKQIRIAWFPGARLDESAL